MTGERRVTGTSTRELLPSFAILTAAIQTFIFQHLLLLLKKTRAVHFVVNEKRQ